MPTTPDSWNYAAYLGATNPLRAVVPVVLHFATDPTKPPVLVVNVTGHDLSFAWKGQDLTVPASGVVVNAAITDIGVPARPGSPVTLVYPNAAPELEMGGWLWEFHQIPREVYLVGSRIAAQAYPGVVVYPVSLPGLERVPADKKRCNPYIFGTYAVPAPSAD